MTHPSPLDLQGIIGLERLEHNLFRGRSPQTGFFRVFGGQVIAQALMAACQTVEGRLPHSLHAYFILGGDPAAPIIYDVDRIRDGRSFATRRVVAIQHGQAIFSLAVSFHNDESGYAHHAPMPDVPPPEDLPDPKAMVAQLAGKIPEPLRRYIERDRAIDLRPVDYSRYFGGATEGNAFHIWIRARADLPDNEIFHRCVLAYASDMTLLDAALVPHRTTLFNDAIQAASLDHSLWFHQPVRADEWLLYTQKSPFAGGGRGLAFGGLYRRDGTLVASVAQEGLIRPKTPKTV
ncbi:MAG: acyl-CoA thioesterase II [Beijerinckiaceae bacterium]